MNHHASGPQPPDHDDPGLDDDQWLDLLAGQDAEGARRATRREAAWLRAALLAYPAQAPQGQPSPPEQRITHLLARARQAGVLPPPEEASAAKPATRAAALPLRPAPPIAAPSRRSPRPIWTWALAASVAGITVLGALRWAGQPGMGEVPGDTTEPESALRGQALQQRRSAQPQADRDQLLAQLRDAGLDARAFERLGRPGIDVELPVPPSDALRAALARLQIEMPAGPSLQIEFIATDRTAAPH